MNHAIPRPDLFARLILIAQVLWEILTGGTQIPHGQVQRANELAAGIISGKLRLQVPRGQSESALFS